MKNVVKFVQEVRREFLRIEWPSLREFLGSTLVVLSVASVFTVLLWIVDKSISTIMYYIFMRSI